MQLQPLRLEERSRQRLLTQDGEQTRKRQTTAEITEELHELAPKAQSADEIAGIAEGAGVELREDEAEALLERICVANEGEIVDEELDNVAGGGCKATQTVRVGEKCAHYFGLHRETACYYRKAHDNDPNVGECGNPLYLA